MTSFVPNPNFDKENSNPKDWAYHLGCLPQEHHIVFTKQDFVVFLKQHNVHVGPNFTELSKLPKYATIGKLTVSDGAGPSSAASAPPVAQQQPSRTQQSLENTPAQTEEDANVVYTSSGEVFRPSRKVRQLPGGGSAQVTALFGSGAEEEEQAPTPARRALTPAPAAAPAAPADDGFEPLGAAPARRVASGNIANESHLHDHVSGEKPGVYGGVRNDAVMNNGFRPTRRVRVPGGTGGVSSISFT
ncbi:hypothetical protein NDA11_003369 [Ustilago hordei]|uniref:Uncharacterized protein n=1 Tax=Ustilago hordei TaxID=120017 RepID=I2FV51_USTHO|nr:uncharacterized protein UHO2_06517 [Ustilago hordei]KAJ1040638.1 hypothetical protein NDA10_002880 [Ustilago hordei]KAJ1571646.1 hypothetical protein NDA11_003369 [Ustilago hordei]KAJ1576549.1 hypothetical protein NDA12_007512 [Ustilago hordei]KAJ1577886.1 hypothetical protein NDA15_005992 [Ustilago hordei]KAJ1598845.1 hypothetical protein NDA14_003344 [Ustilago hordei]